MKSNFNNVPVREDLQPRPMQEKKERPVMKNSLFTAIGLVLLGLLTLLEPGCTTKFPSITTMSPLSSSNCYPYILQTFNSSSDLSNISNGGQTFGTGPVTGVNSGVTVVYSLSPLYATQGNMSLDVDILSAPMTNGTVENWDDKIFFYNTKNIPGMSWNDYSMLIADVYIDASVIQGAGYQQLQLWADSSATNNYYQPICLPKNQPNITAGQQALTWVIDFTAGKITPGSQLSDIYFILNANTTNGTGNIYIDDMRLAYKVCPTPTQ